MVELKKRNKKMNRLLESDYSLINILKSFRMYEMYIKYPSVTEESAQYDEICKQLCNGKIIFLIA